MNKHCLLPILLYLSLTSCINKNFPEFEINGKSVIKLTINNFHDTTFCYYKVTTILPNTCFTDKVEINRNGDYFIYYNTATPDLIHLNLVKDIYTYLLPNDTLIINANLDSLIDKDKSLSIDGIYANIGDYYATKNKTLGFWDIRYAIANIPYTNSLEKLFVASDSIFYLEKEFLSSYSKNHHLPDWFCKIIEMNIAYFRAWYFPTSVEYRKYVLKEPVSNPESYYRFNEMPVYNPDAKLSRFYYEYLDIYFGIKHEDGLVGKSGNERAVPLFSRSLPDIKKELKGEILEFYFAYRMSDLFLSCRKKDELDMVISIFNDSKSLISNRQIINILESEMLTMTNFIETATTNNPFTIRDILSNGN